MTGMVCGRGVGKGVGTGVGGVGAGVGDLVSHMCELHVLISRSGIVQKIDFDCLTWSRNCEPGVVQMCADRSAFHLQFQQQDLVHWDHGVKSYWHGLQLCP